MAKTQKTWSLKEIDEARGASKGTAFLAFKQLKESFDEGRDYYSLNASEDASEIEKLRSDGRIYATTVNAILLTEGGHSAIVDYLDG
ncbi:hypothetical protein [Salinisphaera sp. Q1T1-3]|uniref:hypothetical protein n=1 Tax=Salinisphaera sp. Q1T1-3 TaxID=2321229 RepID=UPI000E75B527|nr:hypothetical protein [Salinisphaera sp. Q1T1-3]RJS95057.1 hypothetical protein D3260_00410 [Salinisphaera sp. Q1T1-3]